MNEERDDCEKLQLKFNLQQPIYELSDILRREKIINYNLEDNKKSEE